MASFRELDIRGEVVVVDNGSSDRSAELAAAAGARVVRHDVRGYGAALRRGIARGPGQVRHHGRCRRHLRLRRPGPLRRPARRGRRAGDGQPAAGPRSTRGPCPGRIAGSARPCSPSSSIASSARISDANCGMRGFRKEAIEAAGPAGRRHGVRLRDGDPRRAAPAPHRRDADRLLPQSARPRAAPALLPRRLAAPPLHAHLVSEVSVLHPRPDPAPRRPGRWRRCRFWAT